MLSHLLVCYMFSCSDTCLWFFYLTHMIYLFSIFHAFLMYGKVCLVTLLGRKALLLHWGLSLHYVEEGKTDTGNQSTMTPPPPKITLWLPDLRMGGARFITQILRIITAAIIMKATCTVQYPSQQAYSLCYIHHRNVWQSMSVM